MLDTPQITTSAPQLMAFIHLTIPRDQIQDVMGPGLMEVHQAISAQEIGPAGPWFTHHLKMDPAIFDFEICVPVNKPIKSAGRVQPGEFPARRVARTVYHGPYEGLGSAWGEFEAWITANGHKPAADLWEVYLAGPEVGPDASKWRTELNRPLV
jgi:effector-binding domain-containing protein